MVKRKKSGHHLVDCNKMGNAQFGFTSVLQLSGFKRKERILKEKNIQLFSPKYYQRELHKDVAKQKHQGR